MIKAQVIVETISGRRVIVEVDAPILPVIYADERIFDDTGEMEERGNVAYQVYKERKTDAYIVKQLRSLLEKQIAWYTEYEAKKGTEDYDSSYTYDMAYEQFNDMSRGELCAILETLADV